MSIRNSHRPYLACLTAGLMLLLGSAAADAVDREADCVALSGRALTAEDVGSRVKAVAELSDDECEQAGLVLAVAALFDDKVAVREEAAYALGEIDDESAVKVLQLVLMDPSRRVREAAIDSVSGIGGEDAAWALASALTDTSGALREEAVYALGEIGGEQAIALLQQAAADKKKSVREAAAEMLAELVEEEEEEDEDQKATE